MKKFLIVPLYFGNLLESKDAAKNIQKVESYAKRSLFFFKSKKDFLILYPEDRKGVAIHYAKSISNILIDAKCESMHEYVSVDCNSENKISPKIATEFAEVFCSENARNISNLVVIVSTAHIRELLNAIRGVFGAPSREKFNTSEIGGIGNTEAFFFDKDDDDSVEHIRFHSHLDFFIPSNPNDFSEQMMKAGNVIHKIIKEKGHTNFLVSLAELIA